MYMASAKGQPAMEAQSTVAKAGMSDSSMGDMVKGMIAVLERMVVERRVGSAGWKAAGCVF